MDPTNIQTNLNSLKFEITNVEVQIEEKNIINDIYDNELIKKYTVPDAKGYTRIKWTPKVTIDYFANDITTLLQDPDEKIKLSNGFTLMKLRYNLHKMFIQRLAYDKKTNTLIIEKYLDFIKKWYESITKILIIYLKSLNIPVQNVTEDPEDSNDEINQQFNQQSTNGGKKNKTRRSKKHTRRTRRSKKNTRKSRRVK